MAKYKYVGSINNVSVQGKGIVKRGDIVTFTDGEMETVSKENWTKVERVKSFDRKLNEFPKHGVREVRQKKKHIN